MPKITRENHLLFRQRAAQLRQERAKKRQQIQNLVQSILHGDPSVLVRQQLLRQSVAIHELIMEEIVRAGTKQGMAVRSGRLFELHQVQDGLIAQLERLGPAMGREKQELHDMVEGDPELVHKEVELAVESEKLTVCGLPNSDTVV